MGAEGTRERLLRGLLRGPGQASALASEAGVDVAGARRHLEALVDEGAATSFFRQEGLGRPKKFYELTAEGRERLDRRYDVLLVGLLRAVRHRHGAGGLSELMGDVAASLAGPLAPEPGLDLAGRVRHAAVTLRRLGFPTDVERRGGGFVLVRRDCPFLRAAREDPSAVCEGLDAELLRVLLGVDAELTACLPHGDEACRHAVLPPGVRSR